MSSFSAYLGACSLVLLNGVYVYKISVKYNGRFLPDIILPLGNPIRSHGDLFVFADYVPTLNVLTLYSLPPPIL